MAKGSILANGITGTEDLLSHCGRPRTNAAGIEHTWRKIGSFMKHPKSQMRQLTSLRASEPG